VDVDCVPCYLIHSITSKTYVNGCLNIIIILGMIKLNILSISGHGQIVRLGHY
jgi:hypothetical protein